MSSLQNICLIGGSGFVGTELATQLTRAGKSIKVLSRDLRHLKTLRVVPTVKIAQVDPYNANDLAACVADQDVIINLVGILNESISSNGTFEQAHVELAKTIIAAAQQTGIKRVIQIGALHADADDSPSEYLRSKGRAAQLLRDSGLDVTIFCPSVIFGNSDRLFNRFANLLHAMPAIPLACADTKFSPVFVADVAAAIVSSIDDPECVGQTFNLCGPEVVTLREIVQYTADIIEVNRPIISLPDGLARAQGFLMELIPGRPFSRDNFNSMQVDSIGLESDPVQSTPFRKIVPTYLGRMNRQSRLQHYRQLARRDS